MCSGAQLFLFLSLYDWTQQSSGKMAAHGKTESLSRQKIDGARRQEDGQRRTSVPKRVHKQQAESGPKNQKNESK